MTDKELKDEILKAVHDEEKDGTFVAKYITGICEQHNIIYDNLRQLERVCESLNKNGMLKCDLTEDEPAVNGVTSEGMTYVDENLMSDEEAITDSLKDTDKLMETGSVNIDIPDKKTITNTDIKKEKIQKEENKVHTNKQNITLNLNPYKNFINAATITNIDLNLYK